MGIEAKIDGRVCHAQMEGDMTVYTAESHRQEWLAHCQKMAKRRIELHNIDLSRVGAMDAAGLQLLVALRRRLTEMNGAMRLVNPSERVRDVLSQTRLSEPFAETGQG